MKQYPRCSAEGVSLVRGHHGIRYCPVMRLKITLSMRGLSSEFFEGFTQNESFEIESDEYSGKVYFAWNVEARLEEVYSLRARKSLGKMFKATKK